MNLSVNKFFFFLMLIFFPLFLVAGKKEMVVIIDPGHGGRDNGATYKNICEKDIVLNIGLKLGQYINEYLPDVKVIYTRDNDSFVPLHMRASLANQSKADLFISLHANYYGIPSITGTETFILGLHRSQENLAVAKKENSVILFEDDYSEHYEGFDPNLSESYIMFELIQDEFMEQSASFANQVQSQFRERTGRKDRGVKQAGFLVLRQTGMPGVLIEAGFLSNPAEAQYLNSDKGQSYIASAIFRAFRNYKKMIESKSEFNLQEPQHHVTENLPAEKVVNTIPGPNIYFSLQVAATRKKKTLTPSNFKGLENIRRIKSGNVYKYFYGKESKPEEIEELKKQIQKKYRDSFIVAFQNDRQIPVKEAIKLIKRN